MGIISQIRDTAGTVWDIKDTTYGVTTTAAAGLAPALPSSGGTTKFLRGDGTWQEAGSSVKTLAVTLTASGWSNDTQTVNATGVTASNTVMVSPAPVSIGAYTDAQIYASAQAVNSITFSCHTIPEVDVTVNVVIL